MTGHNNNVHVTQVGGAGIRRQSRRLKKKIIYNPHLHIVNLAAVRLYQLRVKSHGPSTDCIIDAIVQVILVGEADS